MSFPENNPGSPSEGAYGSYGSNATGAARRLSMSRRNLVLVVLTAVLVVAIALMSVIKVPVAILRPGPATDTLGKVDGKEVISIVGAQTYPTSGALDFTTVSIAGGPNYPVSVLEYLQAKFVDKNAEIEPEEMWFPKNVSGDQIKQQNAADMTDSQETAEVVAMRAAGYKVPEKVLVGAVAEKAPAGDALKVNDELIKVNGKQVTDLASVHAAMGTVKAGATVPVELKRAGRTMTVQARTGAQDGRAIFGIGLNPEYTMPFEVKVNAGNVGGPSAGMMFTLAIYDKITPGALTGGKKVAGTGTMNELGEVGPIGGVQHKMVGAKNAGATYFLAPASDCGEVVGHEPKGMTVVKVSTFAEALAVMPKIAAGQTSGLPSCSPTN